MINKIRCTCVYREFANRLSIHFGIFVLLLLVAPKLSAQVTSNPELEIFTASGTTQSFTITVPAGTTLGSVSVLTLGAPNLDFTSVPAGTTCPNVVAGTCTVEVQFQATAPGRRQGMVVLSDPSGNVLLGISLDGSGTGAMAGFGPGIISTFAGSGTAGDGGPATSALLAGPSGIAVDGFGNHYIADATANKVRKVTAAGVISTFAGTGAPGYSGDGGPATSATLSGPMSVIVDGAGFVYIADTGNNVVRMVNNAGIISTYAGQFYAPGGTPPPVCAGATNSVGDGCPGNQMVMNTPVDMVFCHAQNIHISDKLNNRVRTIMRTTYQTITQVGDGVAGYNGDGELNTSAELNGPTGLIMDAANFIYVADSGNHIIRKTLLTGTIPNPISTVAGTPGSAGNTGDGGLATSAQLNNPRGVAVDPAGDIYISDSGSAVVRKVNIATGTISTVAGTATAGYTGDGGAAGSAQLNVPAGMLLDQVGNLYITDSQSAVVRKVDLSDAPSLTFAGTTVGATSAAQDVTVMDLGTAPLTFSPITAAANYSLAGADTTCNLASGGTLNPGTSCVLGIEFTPTAAGTLNGSIVLTDNSNPTTQTIALTGASAAQTEAYTLAATMPTVAISAGGSGTATLTLTSSNYAGIVSFTTSVTSTDGIPADVTATATPVTLTAGGTGTSTVTIAANSSAANHAPAIPWSGDGTVAFCAFLLGAPLTFRRKRLLAAMPLVLAVALAGFMMACGIVGSQPVPQKTARTYVVTVTPSGSGGVAGAVTVTNPVPVSITVTVQ
jgi:HYDIN/CFA65/VesB family protein/NHL repeat-containing protein